MSEIPKNNPWTPEGYEAQTAAIESRRQIVEPLIGSVITEAVAVYDLLRPRAKHVSEVPNDYPLRYASCVGVSAYGGFTDPVDDSLFIAIGDDHRLSLRRDLMGKPNNPLWKIRRVEPISKDLYHETVLTHWAPHSKYHHPNPYGAEVSSWKYGYVGGDKNCGDRHGENLSGYNNGWFDLEKYLTKVVADLETSKHHITGRVVF